MFGKDQKMMRLKAMEKMGREKPSIEMKPRDEYAMEMEGEEGEGFTSMPVTEAEKAMILAMRKERDGGMEMEEEAEEA